MVAFNRHELKIQCWNIHGAFYNLGGDRYCKLTNDPDVVEHISTYLIFGLVETHHSVEDLPLLQVPGFVCFQVCRTKLKRGRKHGGICVFVHESIRRGVKKVNTAGSESIQIKLNKDYFSLNRDIIVSFSYCVPSGSSFQARTQFDPFDDLEEKISNVSSNFDLICLGDYNSRTAEKPDYIAADDNTDIPVMSSHFVPDTIATYPRGNLDLGTNTYGDRLLDLCQSVPLRICNGRTLGDILGTYTCYSYGEGKSAVDYCLVSPSIFHMISYFVVNDFIPHASDHCSITVTLSTKYMLDQSPSAGYEYIQKPKKVPWNESIADCFEQIIQSNACKTVLSEFDTRPVSSQESMDAAVSSLSDLLVGAALQAAGPTAGVVRPTWPCKAQARNWKFRKRPSGNKPKWFDNTCENLRIQMRITSRLLSKQPGNPYLKGKLVSESKDFQRLRKFKQKQYQDHMFSELDELHSSNPKGYMDLVKSMRNGTFDKEVSDSTSHVSPEKWR